MPRRPLLAEQVADAISTEIADGRLTPGSWLPSWDVLADQHGVGRATARRVVQILSDRGMVETVAGRGAKVTDSAPRRSLEDRVAELERRLAEAPTREEVDELKMKLDVLYRNAGLESEPASSATPRRKRA